MNRTDVQDRLQQALGAAYVIERELGGGGMSRVFVAHEAALGRKVVVKVLRPDLAEGLSADRFKREVRLAARLQHPHIVPLLAAGEIDGGVLFYTMPLVEGESLRARLAREGALPVGATVRTLCDVAGALAYAHRNGVMHRDVKPENILLSDGGAVVADFGIAKAISASRDGDGDARHSSTLTAIGTSLGTPAYMAPEQATGDVVDHRADLYALGVVGYEMLAGWAPFEGRTAQQLLAAHATETPEPITRRRASVPPRLAALIMRLLEKNPADRPQSADELRRALDELPAGEESGETGAVPARAWPPAGNLSSPRWSPDGRWLAYVSDETGAPEAYLRAVAGSGVPVRVSTAGGDFPVWRPDGRELYYRLPDGAIVAVGVKLGPPVALTTPRIVLPAPPLSRMIRPFAVTADGQRFVGFGREDPLLFTLVVNWTARLPAR